MPNPAPVNSIDWFKNNLLTEGLSRPNRYIVHFYPAKPGPPEMQFQPENVTLPGRAFVSVQEQYWGSPRTLPVSNVFDNNVVMTFPLAGNIAERTYFEKWMDLMVDPCNYAHGFESSEIQLSPTVVIQTANSAGEPTSTYSLIEAYPSNIFPMNMGQQMMNDYSRLQVQFTYTTYRYQKGAYTAAGLRDECQN